MRYMYHINMYKIFYINTYASSIQTLVNPPWCNILRNRTNKAMNMKYNLIGR